MRDESKRVLVAAPDGETSRLISSVVADAASSVVSAVSLSSACHIASSESIDLILLDYDLLLLDGKYLELVPDTSTLFIFPQLIVVANRDTWGPCDDAEIWGPPDILWKPFDPEVLLGKIVHKLDHA